MKLLHNSQKYPNCLPIGDNKDVNKAACDGGEELIHSQLFDITNFFAINPVWVKKSQDGL